MGVDEERWSTEVEEGEGKGKLPADSAIAEIAAGLEEKATPKPSSMPSRSRRKDPSSPVNDDAKLPLRVLGALAVPPLHPLPSPARFPSADTGGSPTPPPNA